MSGLVFVTLVLAAELRQVSFTAALGGSFIASENPALGPGTSSALSLGLPLGRLSAFELGVAHADHAITQARGMFPETTVDADAVSGGRRYWSPRLVARFGFPMPMKQEDPKVRAFPVLRIGAGLGYSLTRLDVPSFDGVRRFESQAFGPLFLLGAGAEVRIGPHLCVLPIFDLEGTGYQNGDEHTGAKENGVEWRSNPMLMVGARF